MHGLKLSLVEYNLEGSLKKEQSLSIEVMMAMLVNSTAKMIRTAIEKKPPVAVEY